MMMFDAGSGGTRRGEGDTYSPPAYLREYARGNTGEEPDAYPHAGLVADDEMRQWLGWMAEHYEPVTPEMPASFWQTDFARVALRVHGTEAAQWALDNGRMQVIDMLTGLPSAEADISGVKTLSWLQDWVTRTAGVTLITGHMGTGKTDFALLLAEIWQQEMERDDAKHAVLSNIQTAEGAESVTDMTSLAERVVEDRDEFVLFVMDEAAAHASGDLDDHEVKDQMRQLIRFLRKQRAALIVIGHAEGGRDISPEIRRFAEPVQKHSKKRATVYDAVSEQREYVDPKRELDSIPPTSWEFDTLEESTWEWDLPDDADLSDWAEEAASDDADDEGDDEHVCGAELDDGGRCSRKIPTDAERCHDHRE